MVGERVQKKDLQQEMRESYLAYAMSVIVDRALPDVRDGMKPVHRRVIYAMSTAATAPDRGYSKCARVVGEVMGKYHPHGDSAIYDTLVRMAQRGRCDTRSSTARQLRLPRRRPGSRNALHGMPYGAARHGNGA